MDFRETYCNEVKQELLQLFEPSEVKKILNIIIAKLIDYEITARCTDVAVIDNTSDTLIKNYLGSILTEGKSRNTVYQYRRALQRFMTSITKPLLEANAMDLRIWLANMQSKVSLRSCENYRSYISSFYRWLYLEEIIQRNPMEKVKTITFNEGEKEAFTPSEMYATNNRPFPELNIL